MSELWKDIPGFELYQISNLGRVRTQRPLKQGRPPNQVLKYLGWRFLKISKMNGYQWVTLRADKRKQSFYVHRLLWQMFVGPIPDDKQIDHIDRDRSNCRLENLRIASKSQNGQNSRSCRPNRTGYRGVTKIGQNSYEARIRTPSGKRIRIGVFGTKEEAAVAYNQSAREHHGEFANLNQVPT